MAIRDMRIKRKLTQAELAALLGVSRPAVVQWETGVSSPRASLLPEIAKVLRCSIDKLFD